MPFETVQKIWQISYDKRANVTTTPQKIKDLFAGIADGPTKTMTLTNFSNVPIYFGKDASSDATTAGGIVYAKASIEIPFIDMNLSPFFSCASGTASMGIVLWD